MQNSIRPDRRGLGRPTFDIPAVTLVVAILLSMPIARVWALDAFPGAEGFGRSAQGGRNGRIIPVVNLNDSGPGSLRACVMGAGPRNCVFRVSGVIVLQRSLLIEGNASANLSILGQSAPGGGITLTVSTDSKHFMLAPIIVRDTHDIVIRYLRLRSQVPQTVRNVDAITVQNVRTIYLDHISGSWASDENFNSDQETTDLTVAYSIFGEGLRRHSKCALLGSDAHRPQNISFWRNICISNNDRNPDDNHVRGSCIEITDNLFYNARSQWAEIFTQKAGTPISYVGNYFKAGPSTRRDTIAINWDETKSVAPPSIHVAMNELWAPPGKTIRLLSDNAPPFVIEQPPCPRSASTFGDPKKTFKEVKAKAGSLPHDEVDRRFVREIGPLGIAGTGKLRAEPGSIEPIASASPYVDADGDGMADSVEAELGAKAGVFDPWSGGREGWSSFDRFMQHLADERLANDYPE